MIRNWIVRKGVPSVEVDEESDQIQIRSARKVSIRDGDVLVLLSEKYVFTHAAKALQVAELPAATERSEPPRTTVITHTGWRLLEPPVEFELFTSSLTFVTSLHRPKLHLPRISIASGRRSRND